MSTGPGHFVFTMSAGRTGTTFLAELCKHNLSGAEVHHEIRGYDSFGVDTPDISHLTLFNSRGNVEKVQAFWKQKFERIRRSPANYYIETSHVLMKAGLAENLDQLGQGSRIHMVVLTRDEIKTVMSYRNRCDFLNKGNMWMWYLDPDYPKNIVDATPFTEYGLEGVCLWYLAEIKTRVEYYRLLLSGDERVSFLEVDLDDLNDENNAMRFFQGIGTAPINNRVVVPQKVNANVSSIQYPDGYVEQLQQLQSRLAVDTKAKAEWFLSSGRSL